MRALGAKAVAALAACVAVLGVPNMALANGGDFHFGGVTTGVPALVVYGFGGFVGLVVAFFAANWARYKRAQGQGGLSRGSGASQRREEEEDNGERREGE